MRVTASYSYEEPVAAAIETYAVDHDGVSAIGLRVGSVDVVPSGILTWVLLWLQSVERLHVALDRSVDRSKFNRITFDGNP